MKTKQTIRQREALKKLNFMQVQVTTGRARKMRDKTKFSRKGKSKWMPF